jgi:hypothetical protein
MSASCLEIVSCTLCFPRCIADLCVFVSDLCSTPLIKFHCLWKKQQRSLWNHLLLSYWFVQFGSNVGQRHIHRCIMANTTSTFTSQRHIHRCIMANTTLHPHWDVVDGCVFVWGRGWGTVSMHPDCLLSPTHKVVLISHGTHASARSGTWLCQALCHVASGSQPNEVCVQVTHPTFPSVARSSSMSTR